MNELVNSAYALECKAYLDAMSILNEDPQLAIDAAELYVNFVSDRACGDGYSSFKRLTKAAEDQGYDNNL